MSRHLGALCALASALFLAACASPGGPSPEVLESPEALLRIERQALEIVGDATDDREKAVRIFRFVRDEIEYGFTPRFDAADPLYTLEVGRGHCNPQTTLFVALARAAGLEARQHFVDISDEILEGVWPKRAPRSGVLNHSFAEVEIDGSWHRLDGYTVDAPLLAGAQRLLEEKGLEVGYAAHRESCRDWDGTGDCMTQFASPDLLLPGGDHGTYADPTRFYDSEAYSQKMGSVTRALYRWVGMRVMNSRLDEIRGLPTLTGEAAAPAASGASD